NLRLIRSTDSALHSSKVSHFLIARPVRGAVESRRTLRAKLRAAPHAETGQRGPLGQKGRPEIGRRRPPETGPFPRAIRDPSGGPVLTTEFEHRLGDGLAKADALQLGRSFWDGIQRLIEGLIKSMHLIRIEAHQRSMSSDS